VAIVASFECNRSGERRLRVAWDDRRSDQRTLRGNSNMAKTARKNCNEFLA
jgi:hypothetical protein